LSLWPIGIIPLPSILGKDHRKSGRIRVAFGSDRSAIIPPNLQCRLRRRAAPSQPPAVDRLIRRCHSYPINKLSPARTPRKWPAIDTRLAFNNSEIVLLGPPLNICTGLPQFPKPVYDDDRNHNRDCDQTDCHVTYPEIRRMQITVPHTAFRSISDIRRS
jgi:hypothetical protein